MIKVTASDTGAIEEAANIIKSGGLVAFPTETVYGLGADGLNKKACQRIYEVKGRPNNKPLSLLVSDMAMIEELADISPLAERLINRFMPGPLTLILPSRKSDSTVGVRMPANDITLALIKAANVPIAAPSANISGQSPPTTAQEVFNAFNGKIPLILDGGACQFGVSSTIVNLTKEEPLILREGAISLKSLNLQ